MSSGRELDGRGGDFGDVPRVSCVVVQGLAVSIIEGSGWGGGKQFCDHLPLDFILGIIVGDQGPVGEWIVAIKRLAPYQVLATTRFINIGPRALVVVATDRGAKRVCVRAIGDLPAA